MWIQLKIGGLKMTPTDQLKQIDETLNELYAKRSVINQKIKNLHADKQAAAIDKLKPLVGMCFKISDHKWCKIMGTPKSKIALDDYHYHFDDNQLPAIFICEDPQNSEGIVYFDTLFSKAVEFDDPIGHIRKEHQEISENEFMQIIYRVVSECTRISI